MQLRTKAETDSDICGYLNAKTHWMIIPSLAATRAIVIPLEETYFNGERNKDFIAMMYPHKGRLFNFFFAAKKYLSAAQFHKICTDHGAAAVPQEAFEARDIVFLGEDLEFLQAAAELLNELDDNQILDTGILD
jgi:hypothetical protein